MRILGILSAALLLTAFLPFGLPTVDASDDGPDHVFECGFDVPPSGTYLHDRLTGPMYYDCKTRTLTPSGEEPANCAWEVHDGRFVPLYGLCIGMSRVTDESGATLEDTYSVDVLIALAGVNRVDAHGWYTQTEHGKELDCQTGEACFPDPVCVSDLLVTYCKEHTQDTVDCSEGALNVTGLLAIAHLFGSTSTSTAQTAHLCTA